MILAHHEQMIQAAFQYLLMLLPIIAVCFLWFFPMLGKVIIKLNQRLQNRIKELDKQKTKWEDDVLKIKKGGLK